MPLNGSRLGHYQVTALIGEGGMGRSIESETPNSTAQSRSTSCFGGYVGDRDRVVALEWPQEAT